ncbi:hypothetical protein OTERR_28400 [Oryzomicrobium terrae]|uniref:Uncharacterized protein n=1 Tax=Oryzomicrobium terrae TaxID=1735038 RepID=A0A5C1EBT2_9RHOO|nr:response regulator transcription factor [Oryzomicrobium terrae]QEL66316.1 hypothetical protein OTERR_28400 [Oryzomicrobium terrae]
MKFLLIDDHALFRHGLLLLLEKLPGDHEFLQADDCEGAFALLDGHRNPDLILLDLALPGMNGLDGVQRFRELCPTTPIVLLSANENPQFIMDGMGRGAHGFIPKSAKPEVVMAALQVVLAGGTYMPSLRALRPPVSGTDSQALTERQREVLALLARNKSNKEIADALGMRVNTARVHVSAILKSLGVESREDAARVALGQLVVSDGA